MVTRTIENIKVTVLAMDIEKCEPLNLTTEIPVVRDDKILSAVRTVLDTETIKVVSIVDTVRESTLYGMTESEFMKNASVLPERKVKCKE